MKRVILFTLSILVISLTVSCNTKINKMLSAHQGVLYEAAIGKLSPEKKLDILAKSFVGLMSESLSFTNPKKGIRYINQYTKSNEKSINMIMNEVGDWQSKMSFTEKLALGMKLLKKPYAKDMVKVVPKFERKYKQIKFASKMTSWFKKRLWGGGK